VHATRATSPSPPAVSESRPAARDDDGPPLAPLTDSRWLERVDLPGGEVGFVSVPLGATKPRPVVVAVHGAGDRPEWACGGWRGVTEAFPFIVCPQGKPTGDGRFYWASSAQLDRVIQAAVSAVHERFGGYVADTPMVYAGFSSGAIYGASVVTRRAEEFPAIMMAEGGYEALTDLSFAARFFENGGRRALLGCSTGGGCLAKMSEARRLLSGAGVEARVNDAGTVGHNLNAEAVRSLRRDWPWLVEGRKGWENYRATSTLLRRSQGSGSKAAAVSVEEEEVPDDLPAFFLRGGTGAKEKMVFLTGACTHPQGYVQSFQFAAHEKGSVLAPQGDVSCGGPYRSWSFDLAKQNARIQAGFAAAGEESDREIVLIGYSQGARLAELLADRYPERYTRLILIGAPTQPSATRLRRAHAVVMMAGEYDATERMKAGARNLVAAGVPTIYLEMPKAKHGQMSDAERTMGQALDWVTTPR
jgi:predicted esterase